MKKSLFIIFCLLSIVTTTSNSEQLTNENPSVLKKLNELTIEPEIEKTTQKVKENTPAINALELWDDNNNGRITCKEARKHGIAPVPKDHPAYGFMRDADKDGIVCER